MSAIDALAPLARHALAAACAACFAAGASAQSVVGVGASGVPGGSASVHFDFDFGSGFAVEAMTFSLDWDASRLTLNGASALYNGNPVDPAAVLGAIGEFQFIDNSASGNLAALWAAVDANQDPLPPLELMGTARLSFQYLLAPTFPVPGSSPVSLSMLLSRGDTPIELSAVASIQAVPEPQTWALWLAGVAGLAAWARRRA